MLVLCRQLQAPQAKGTHGAWEQPVQRAGLVLQTWTVHTAFAARVQASGRASPAQARALGPG